MRDCPAQLAVRRWFEHFAAGLILFLSIARIGSASPAQIIRGPYLQIGTPTTIIVRWRSDMATDSLVLFGATGDRFDQTNQNPGLTTEHEVKLTGLSPNTRYFYSVGDSSAINANVDLSQYFITAPVVGTAKLTRIWVIGDAGKNTPEQASVRDAFYQLEGTNHTDFWLQLGDNAYETGTDEEYQGAFFDMYASLLKKSVTWPTLGNHDTATLTNYSNSYPYFSIFTLPTAGEAGGEPSGTEHYYSFDYANLHLVCLDSMATDRSATGAMAFWLEADLQANTQPWIIAFWHHPPYSKGSHDSDVDLELIEMRQNFLPILERYGVDLVLGGHSHCYERSYLLNGHYGFSTNLAPAMMLDHTGGPYVKPRGFSIPNRGAIYAVAGNASHVTGGALDHPAMYLSTNVLGSMLLTVNSNRLDAIFLRETGAIDDRFTIFKTNFPPVASNLIFTVNANTSSQLRLAGSDINHDPLRFIPTSLPAHGLISQANPNTGTFVYTPARGFTNTDSFSFLLDDGDSASPPANVTIAVNPLPDNDHNGLPDDWEALYAITDPEADEDHDGMSNRQEYFAGTNPRDPQSWLKISSLNPVNGGFSISWPSVGGVRYRVLYGDGDSTGGFNGVFAPIVRPVAQEMDAFPLGVSSVMTFIDNLTQTPAPARGVRYYRIEVVQ